MCLNKLHQPDMPDEKDSQVERRVEELEKANVRLEHKVSELEADLTFMKERIQAHQTVHLQQKSAVYGADGNPSLSSHGDCKEEEKEEEDGFVVLSPDSHSNKFERNSDSTMSSPHETTPLESCSSRRPQGAIPKCRRSDSTSKERIEPKLEFMDEYPRIQKDIDVLDKTLIGVDHICEIQRLERDPIYICFLCSANMASKTQVLEHIVSAEHFMAFMKEHNPREYDLLKDTEIAKSHLPDVLEEHTVNENKRVGTGKMQTKREKPGNKQALQGKMSPTEQIPLKQSLSGILDGKEEHYDPEVKRILDMKSNKQALQGLLEILSKTDPEECDQELRKCKKEMKKSNKQALQGPMSPTKPVSLKQRLLGILDGKEEYDPEVKHILDMKSNKRALQGLLQILSRTEECDQELRQRISDTKKSNKQALRRLVEILSRSEEFDQELRKHIEDMKSNKQALQGPMSSTEPIPLKQRPLGIIDGTEENYDPEAKRILDMKKNKQSLQGPMSPTEQIPLKQRLLGILDGTEEYDPEVKCILDMKSNKQALQRLLEILSRSEECEQELRKRIEYMKKNKQALQGPMPPTEPINLLQRLLEMLRRTEECSQEVKRVLDMKSNKQALQRLSEILSRSEEFDQELRKHIEDMKKNKLALQGPMSPTEPEPLSQRLLEMLRRTEECSQEVKRVLDMKSNKYAFPARLEILSKMDPEEFDQELHKRMEDMKRRNLSTGTSLTGENRPTKVGGSGWSPWLPCSATCGMYTHSRMRHCTNPEPQYGGSVCLGNDKELRECTLMECPGNKQARQGPMSPTEPISLKQRLLGILDGTEEYYDPEVKRKLDMKSNKQALQGPMSPAEPIPLSQRLMEILSS